MTMNAIAMAIGAGAYGAVVGVPGPGLSLVLSDSGAGVVNLVPAANSGSGTPTFTRATVAWTKLSSGLWAQVASGSARASYLGFDTAVGAFGGYYCENAGIQLVTPTASIRDMTDASWVATTMTTAKTSTGIDGVASSCTRLTAAGDNSTLLQTLVAAASSRTYSCWVRRVTGTGTILLKSGAATLDITALINSTTFTRVSLTDSTLNTSFGIQINTSTDAIDVDFNQFEAGAFATSPMASAGAARNIDVLTYPFASNMLDTVGTIYTEALTEDPTANSSPRGIVATSANAAGSVHIIQGNGATTTQTFRDGTNVVQATGLADLATAMRKNAVAFGGVTASQTRDGAAVQSGAFDGQIDSTNIGIGNTNGVQAFNGFIKNVRIWKTKIIDSTLIAMTTP